MTDQTLISPSAQSSKNLPLSFLVLRLSIGIFLMQWAIEKFVRPEHTEFIFRIMYKFEIDVALSPWLGAAQAIIVLAFMAGFQKRISYALVFAMHFMSNIASWQMLINPYFSVYPGSNLFMTGVPVLVAMGLLYVLRDLDTLWSLDNWLKAKRVMPIMKQ